MIIICTNAGRLRAFRITQSDTRVEPTKQIGDQAGRFSSDGSPGMARGEAHGLEQEEERRLIAQVAEKIAALIKEENPDRWQLAAPQTINSRILDALDPSVRESLAGNEKHDFTKLPTLEVGRRFGHIS